MKEILDVRQPLVEGLFYPDEPQMLKSRIKELLESNKSQVIDSNTLILPHGGWDYTGDYLAKGFNSLGHTKFNRVIVISNVHREFSNNIILPESKKFRITDQKIKVDKKALDIIKKRGKKVITSNIPHMEEHSIETILPFISYLYPNAEIVPILLGKTIVSLVRNLTNILNEIKDNNTLVIISSNYSSYEKEEISRTNGELGIDLTIKGKMGELVELTRINKLKTCGAGAISSAILLGDYSDVVVLKQGLSPQTPLSAGKSTYYASITFRK